jgi:hypothetical protein
MSTLDELNLGSLLHGLQHRDKSIAVSSTHTTEARASF